MSMKAANGVFITFSGTCRKALTYYQEVFGGRVVLQEFDKALPGVDKQPVISGALYSERITIRGSDMVPDEGLRPGNDMCVFFQCRDHDERELLLHGLSNEEGYLPKDAGPDRNLLEITDRFGVRWLLAG